jgi:hypothetical protein
MDSPIRDSEPPHGEQELKAAIGALFRKGREAIANHVHNSAAVKRIRDKINKKKAAKKARRKNRRG